jgi:alpha-tubulin suppressor-like RCC1 family protein
MVTRSLFVLLLLACGPRIVIVPVEDTVRMSVRVRDDLCPVGGCERDRVADLVCTEPGPEGLAVLDLDVAHSHACVVLSSQEVRCWGADHSGQLGDGGYGRHATPIRVAGIPPSIAVGVGRAHSCALAANGEVWCWGDNGVEQLGASNVHSSSSHAVRVSSLAHVDELAVGYEHTCAIARGAVWCWGRNQLGQLGNGNRDRYEGAQHVPSLRAVRIAAGGDSTCAIKPDGSVLCWGGINVSPRPLPVSGLPIGAVEIAVGQSSACARIGDGSVWCWGDGTHGQLGPRVRTTSDAAVIVEGLPPAMELDLYGTHACTVDPQHQVWCWGSEEAFDRDASAPHMVSYLAPVESAAIGDEAACARSSEGGVCCWGSNIDGLLGATRQPFASPPFVSEVPIPMMW